MSLSDIITRLHRTEHLLITAYLVFRVCLLTRRVETMETIRATCKSCVLQSCKERGVQGANFMSPPRSLVSFFFLCMLL